MVAGSQSVLRESRLRDIKWVTLVGAMVNLLLAVVKIAVGLLANSQSLVADGIHSLSDLLSDGLVWFAAHHSAQEPDEDHPYGHERFETLATLGLGIMLLLVAVGIVWDAVARLFSPDTLQIPGIIAAYAAIFSVLSNEWLYHYTKKMAKRHRSQMLHANAWHHRSDSVSSVVVLIGVAGTMSGLPYLDTIAAIIVGVMIAHIAWELTAPAIRELADTGLEEERLQQIRDTIQSVSGVNSIHMLRTRRSGASASMDVHVIVTPWLSVSEGHMIGQQVTDCLLNDVEELSDVTVHIDPEDDETGVPCQGLPLRADAEKLLGKAWNEISEYATCKRLLLHYLDGQIDVDLQYSLDNYSGKEEFTQLQLRYQDALDDYPQFRNANISFHTFSSV